MVEKITNNHLEELIMYLQVRKKEDPKKSYTSFLLQNPDILVKKLNEEGFETIIEVLNKNKKKLVKESADLIYHLLVAWIYSELDPKDVWKELEKRKKISGLDEKKKRTQK